MAGPLLALGKTLLGSELVSRLQNEGYLPSIRGAGRSPGAGGNIPLSELLANSASPLARLLGLLPEERPNYNLPTDYSVGPQGAIYSSSGDRMQTGEGVTSFQPEGQFDGRGFQEPAYEPPIPWNYSLQNAGEIPSQIALQSPQQEFPQQRTYSWERDVSGVDSGAGSVPLPQVQGPTTNMPRPEGYPSEAPWPPPGAGSGFMPSVEGLPSLQQQLTDPVNYYSDLAAGLPSPAADKKLVKEPEEEIEYWIDALEAPKAKATREMESIQKARGGVVISSTAGRNKRQKAETAKMKAQALLRTGVPMPDEYRQGGRVRMI